MSAHPPFAFCSIFFFSAPNRTYKPRFFFFLSQLELHVTGNEAPACQETLAQDGLQTCYKEGKRTLVICRRGFHQSIPVFYRCRCRTVNFLPKAIP